MDIGLFIEGYLPWMIGVVVLVPLVLVGYISGSEWIVRRLPEARRPRIRPWFWVGPALAFVTLFLVYPALGTLYVSFFDKHGQFIALGKYAYMLGDFPTGGAWIAIRNNLNWLVFYTFFILFFGL